MTVHQTEVVLEPKQNINSGENSATTKMSEEEFLLKWNDHHASFFNIVEDLCRTEQELVTYNPLS